MRPILLISLQNNFNTNVAFVRVAIISSAVVIPLLVVATIQIEMTVFGCVLFGVIEMDIALEYLWFAVTVIPIATGRKADRYWLVRLNRDIFR